MGRGQGSPRAIQMCLWSCLIRPGLCVSVAGPAAAAAAAAASAISSAAVASTMSTLVSCSPLVVPAVVIALAICGGFWPVRSGAAAVCLAAAAACLPGAAAAPAEASASSTAFSWLAEGGAMPLSFIFAVGAFAATADLVLRQLRWRRNGTAAISPPVVSPPPSPPESAGRPSELVGGSTAVMRSFDKNQDGVIDAEEAAAIARDMAVKDEAKVEAQREAAGERKISRVFRRFARVLLLALLASVGINAGLTAGIIYAVKDTKVGDGGLLVSSDTGEVLKVASADIGVDSEVLVDADGNAVKTQAAVYKASFDSVDAARILLDATPDALDSLSKLRVQSDGAQVELTITGWASKSCSVFGVQPTSDEDGSYWAFDLANVSQARTLVASPHVPDSGHLGIYPLGTRLAREAPSRRERAPLSSTFKSCSSRPATRSSPELPLARCWIAMMTSPSLFSISDQCHRQTWNGSARLSLQFRTMMRLRPSP